MNGQNQEIKYFVSTELGKRLPFAITNYKEIIQSDDIFIPSLRDFHVIFWIKKGVGRYVVDFKEYNFKAGSLILLSKDQLHYFLPFDKEQTEIVSIGFKPEYIYRSDFDSDHLFKFIVSANQENEQTILIPDNYEKKFQRICDDLNEVSQEWKDEHKFKGFYHNLCLFLIQCEILVDSLRGEQSNLPNKNIADFITFTGLLENHFKSEFRVEFYLEQLNVSLKVLTKLTKTYFKASPKSVIDQRRILEIKRLLKGTAKSSKAISYDLNFDEPTNMFKFFKKHVGLTPKEFKEQV